MRLEVGSRTITIPMDRNLLVNTEKVILALGPLYSEIDGTTLEKINDGTLSNNIVSLALRVSTTIVCSFPYALVSLQVLTFFSSFCRWLL